jgi:hypothetical protein
LFRAQEKVAIVVTAFGVIVIEINAFISNGSRATSTFRAGATTAAGTTVVVDC